MEKQIYIVESYCDDQQESYSDLVLAKDEDEANQRVSAVRDYAIVTYTELLSDFVKRAAELAKTTPEKVAASWAELMERESKANCRTCGEVYDLYGDGYDGMCPSCADKTEPT